MNYNIMRELEANINYDDEYESDGGNEQPLLRSEDVSPPVDRWNIVYIIMYFLGVASLLPWNFFITASDYFSYKLRNTSSNVEDGAKTDLQQDFESYLSISSQLPNALFLILNTFFLTHYVSLRMRVLVPLIAFVALFGLTVILTRVDTDLWQYKFFIITLASAALMNATTAILNGAIFGVGAILPGRYMNAAMSGQALGGLFSVVCSLVSLAFVAADPSWSAFVYFVLAVVATVLSIVAYLLLERTEYFLHYLALSKRGQQLSVRKYSEGDPVMQPERESLFNIVKKLWIHALSVYLTFATTLSVFPALLSLVEPIENVSPTTERFFTPVVCFLFFNLTDYCGRVISGWVPVPKDKSWLILFCTVLRFGLVPLFMLCNAPVQQRHLPVYFGSSVYPIVLNIVLGLTNGYFATLGVTYGPKEVSPSSAEVAGSFMALCIILGLSTGAALSLAVVHFV